MVTMRKTGHFATLQLLITCAALVWPTTSRAAQSDHPTSELIGRWRGTSVCSDRVAAPACNDESVVYDFTAGEKPGTVHWKADKIVDGKRLPMGEFDVTYSRDDACWRAELTTPRFHMIWRVAVDGATLKGTAMLLPGKQIVRKIEARKHE
jgi:hypothetical protein